MQLNECINSRYTLFDIGHTRLHITGYCTYKTSNSFSRVFNVNYLNRYTSYSPGIIEHSRFIRPLYYYMQYRYTCGYPHYTNHYKKKIKLKKENLNMNNNLNALGNAITNEIKRRTLTHAVTHIRNNFGVTLKFEFDRNNMKKFLCWLKKYDKNFKSHIEPATVFGGNKHYMLKDCDFIIKCGERTFARIYTQSAIKNSLSEVDIFSDNAHVNESQVYMYIFGKECYKVAKAIKKINNDRNIGCYKVSASKHNKEDANSTPDIYFEDLKGRNKDSIFLNGSTKETIINHIDNFLKNRDIYEKRNLLFKTGILLYGEPGTGKSSIANMIATEYSSDMVLINMSEFNYINTDFLATTINADDKFYIVVLEDIDCVIGDRESEDDDLENKKNVNKLLQFLDSTSSPSNVIFVATTNHIEKLDDAIKRDGRFDLVVNITNINKETATKMCKSFGITDENTINNILDNNMKYGTINPAKLQNLILQNIELNINK